MAGASAQPTHPCSTDTIGPLLLGSTSSINASFLLFAFSRSPTPTPPLSLHIFPALPPSQDRPRYLPALTRRVANHKATRRASKTARNRSSRGPSRRVYYYFSTTTYCNNYHRTTRSAYSLTRSWKKRIIPITSFAIEFTAQQTRCGCVCTISGAVFQHRMVAGHRLSGVHVETWQ